MALSLTSFFQVHSKICLGYSSLHKCRLSQPLLLVRYCSNKPVNKLSNRSKNNDADHGKTIHPKVLLANIFNSVCHAFGAEFSPRYNSDIISHAKGIKNWRTTLTLKWPKKLSFEGIASSKKEGEKKTAALAWAKFKELGVLTTDNQPLIYSKEQQNEIIKQIMKLPRILFKPHLENDVRQTIKEWQEFRSSGTLSEDVDAISSQESAQKTMDIITGRVYYSPRPEELSKRNSQMQKKYFHNHNSDTMTKVQHGRQRLPIWDQREAIIAAIEKSQVVVLSGETGCGKSTQVPQFILEEFVQHGKGAECNMVITQPRRISAISLAEYVASEYGEQLGDTIGYQVRLDANRPRQRGGILFCTTGILLRHLESNPNLTGVSHVIVDEAHERDIFIDILLVLLKDAVQNNPHLRVLVMSASLNAKLFSGYFNNCPMFHVPGFMHPVKQHFLPEVLSFIGQNGRPEFSNEEKVVADYYLITNLIKKIDGSKPQGGILCFLPGWQEIKAVEKYLQNALNSINKYLILPVHSSLPHHIQRRIFERAPPNVRKIILATNIAETSITIDDIVYVIDCGIAKDNTYNARTGLTCIGSEWISKANVRQRKGRAGRVQPGECFHLFTQEKYRDMPDYPIPEIKRVALESIILDTKALISNVKSEDFLSKAIEPPERETVFQALKELRDIGAIDPQENLTTLGQHLVNINCHPRLAKTLIYSILFSCAEPLLNIVAALSHYRDPFVNTMEEKTAIREVKSDFADGSLSDHIALANICNTWTEQSYSGKDHVSAFCNKYQLNYLSMYFISGLKKQLSIDLKVAGFLDPSQPENEHINENSSDYELVKTILCAGLTNNIAKIKKGTLRNNRFSNKIFMSLVFQKSIPLMVRGDSVIKKLKEFPSPWLVFFNKIMSLESKMVILKDVSVVSPLAVLLFSGKEIITRQPTRHQMDSSLDDDNSSVILTVDNASGVQFICSPGVAYLVTEFRQVLSEFITACLESPECLQDETSEINPLRQRIINTVSLLVNSFQSDHPTQVDKHFSKKKRLMSKLSSADYDD